MELKFNGLILDEVVPGFTTANVEGRGILSPVFSTVNIPGRDGSFVFDQKLPSREIVVHYRMLADNATEFLERMNFLHEILRTGEDVEFHFSDEQYYRLGRLAGSTPPPYDFYRGFGSFTLLCQDPYKYRDILPITGADLSTMEYGTAPYRINEIRSTISTNRTGFEVMNYTTGRKILVAGSFTAGQSLVILPSLTLNGQNVMNRLDFTSDWADFKINPGDRIIAPQPITLDLSERDL